MKWRRLTRLEGMLLGALVSTLQPRPTDDALCHKGYFPADRCPRCSKILEAHDLVDKVLKMQRTPPKKRSARKPAPRGGGRRTCRHGSSEPVCVACVEASGRGGKRVGERRQAARTVHIIDADSSARDIELARNDLASFFGDVLEKHHPGGY